MRFVRQPCSFLLWSMALAFLSREISAADSEFLVQPREQFVRAGSAVEFRVEPDAAASVGFQWERNGILIPGATNSTLTLTNVQVLDEGSYTASIFTEDGPVKANPAGLTVCWQVELVSVRSNLPPLAPIPSTVTDSLGNVYSGIFLSGSPASARRTNDFNITKFDPNGNLLWTSGPVDPQKAITPTAWAMDHENNLIVAGGRFPLSVAKFTPGGETLWSIPVDDRPIVSLFAYSVLIDRANNILVTMGDSNPESFSAYVSTFQLSPNGQRNWTIGPPIYTYYGVTGLPVVGVDSESNFYMFGYVALGFFLFL